MKTNDLHNPVLRRRKEHPIDTKHLFIASILTFPLWSGHKNCFLIIWRIVFVTLDKFVCFFG